MNVLQALRQLGPLTRDELMVKTSQNEKDLGDEVRMWSNFEYVDVCHETQRLQLTPKGLKHAIEQITRSRVTDRMIDPLWRRNR